MRDAQLVPTEATALQREENIHYGQASRWTKDGVSAGRRRSGRVFAQPLSLLSFIPGTSGKGGERERGRKGGRGEERGRRRGREGGGREGSFNFWCDTAAQVWETLEESTGAP